MCGPAFPCAEWHFRSRYRVQQHHTSKAANLWSPEGSFRTLTFSEWWEEQQVSGPHQQPQSQGAIGVLKAYKDRGGSRQMSMAHHQQPQQPHPDCSPQQTFSRGSTTLLQEENGHSSCGSFSHRHKAMSHCNPCTESNCYQCTTGQLQREVTETY